VHIHVGVGIEWVTRLVWSDIESVGA
jgi:hypothetical protein